MGEMINSIAHQWRQPLNILGLSVQQMRMYFDKGLFSQEYLHESVNKFMGLINHMSRTIDDFRDFFKPDKEKSKFTIHEQVLRAISLVEDSFSNNHISIEIDVQANPSIIGFPNEFSHVLLNILVNAKDVLLERRPDNAKVTVTLTEEGDRAVVTIADNAGGIAEEIMDKIFEPYFTTKGPNRGTGIGLFMSKIIIEKNMNGRLSVRNISEGAEFRIEVRSRSLRYIYRSSLNCQFNQLFGL
jgi:signal transduction histidine kinase